MKTMERKEKRNISKNLLKGTLLVGTLFSVSSLTAATTSNLFDYDTMGSGAEVRSEILNTPSSLPVNNFEMKCGEDQKTTGKEAKTETKKESKSEEHKCGEGKCGDKKKEVKADSTKMESKAKEAKCGEGKCGK